MTTSDYYERGYCIGDCGYEPNQGWYVDLATNNAEKEATEFFDTEQQMEEFLRGFPNYILDGN